MDLFPDGGQEEALSFIPERNWRNRGVSRLNLSEFSQIYVVLIEHSVYYRAHLKYGCIVTLWLELLKVTRSPMQGN